MLSSGINMQYVLKYSIAPLFDIRCCRNNPMFDKLYELYDEFVDAQYH